MTGLLAELIRLLWELFKRTYYHPFYLPLLSLLFEVLPATVQLSQEERIVAKYMEWLALRCAFRRDMASLRRLYSAFTKL